MAKPILPKSAPVATPAAASEPTNAAPEKPALTKEEKRALFAVPRTIDASIEECRAKIAELETEKSSAIKAIQDACGHGPFQIKEGTVRISSRTVKKDDGTEYTVHFFKGKGQPSVEKID